MSLRFPTTTFLVPSLLEARRPSASGPLVAYAIEVQKKGEDKLKMVEVKLVRHMGKVTKILQKGRQIAIMHDGKEVKAKVSGSRTKITVDGKSAKRSAVKEGMTCTFNYPGPGEEAQNIDCKT